MFSLNIGQMICICVIGGLTVLPVYSWNSDYFNYDDTPILPHYADIEYKLPTYEDSLCDCIKLKECSTLTFKLRTAPKPLSSNLMKDIRKKACGFIGNDPLICCPSSDVLARTFRDVTTEKPWIWDSETKPMEKHLTNIFNRLNPDDVNWDKLKRQPNNVQITKKPFTDKNFYTRKTKKYNFFNFEDPRTHRNCPPSFSPDFHIPPYFENVKPFKHFQHISSEVNGFGFNHAEYEPNFIFPNSLPNHPVNDLPTFPSLVAKHPIEKLSLINADNCGISIQPRIIGGKDAFPGQFPWVARLAYRNRTSQLVSYRCSGSVISKKYILTAAHCVTNLVDDLELIYVRLGELDSKSNLCDNHRHLCTEPQDYEIESIEHHPNYDMPKYANDIALIRLRYMTNSNFVSPLCLPIGSFEATDKNLDQKMGIIAGWGVSTTQLDNTDVKPMLQYLRLPIVNTQSCANSYASYSANSRLPIIISDSQICVQGTANQDACQGDSGGPLMREDHQSGRYILLGLVSFGPRTCGVAAFPGVYSRTASHLNWILNTMKL